MQNIEGTTQMRYLFLTIMLTFASLSAQDQPTQMPVNEQGLARSSDAATQWLKYLDSRNYDGSWKAGSLTFKLTIPQKHWVTLLDSIRKPLGDVISRKLLEQRVSKNPKGLPKGDYMVLFYETAFSKKSQAHELITMVQESDGNWRVLTYQVQ